MPTTSRFLVVLLTLGAAGGAQSPAGLELFDLTTGTSTGTATQGALVPSHSVKVRVSGNAGDRIAVGFSSTPGPSGLSYNGVPVSIDTATMTVLWNGFVDPNAPVIGPAGYLDVPFTVPDAQPLGTSLVLQGLVGPATGGPPLITNPLTLTWDGEAITSLGSGTNSGHPAAATAGFLAFTDSLSFANFWALHQPGGGAAPFVDFSTSFALIRFRGAFTSLATSPTITDVYRDASNVMQVFTTITFPGVPPPPFPSEPWHAVSVPNFGFSPTLNDNVTQIFFP